MALQYPDTILLTLALAPTKDAQGNPVVHSGNTLESICRAERQLGNPTLQDAAGNHLLYRFKVFMPPLNQTVPFGSRATLSLHTGEQYTGQIREAVTGQFNSQLCL